jgi:D-methionine transport system substrate-binding protein
MGKDQERLAKVNIIFSKEEVSIMNPLFIVIHICLSACLCLTFSQNRTKLIVGATPVPHAEILEKALPILEAEGIDLKIRVFTDYITPNLALNAGDLDVNFFQHQPYLEDFNKSHKLDLVSAGSIHFEPLGIYSKKIKLLSELKSGDKIAVPSDLTNEARALLLLQDNGILILKNPKDLKSTTKDIQLYKVNVQIVEIEAAQLTRTLSSVAAAVINGNYAIDAGLNPSKDAIVSEKIESIAAKTYANIIVVRKGNQSRPEIQRLVSVLKSEPIQRFINDNYQKAVVPIE